MNKKRFTIRIPENLYKKLTSLSKDSGRSINDIIIQALWEFVEKK